MPHTDVLILGAGPAGATAALNLAPHHRVLLLDRLPVPVQRIGESLPPATRRLLADMGLWDEFLAQQHNPCHGNRSIWGGHEAEHDFLRDPDGSGWHIDRARFEAWLRRIAQERGAALLTDASVSAITEGDEGWLVDLKTINGATRIHAKTLIDASGRNASLAKKLGACRLRQDKLICSWVYGRDLHVTDEGLSHIEAAEHGWWYSAALPGQRRVLAFHTDSDLSSATDSRCATWLHTAAHQLPALGRLLRATGFVVDTDVKLTPAHSAISEPPAGRGWFAVGDAALCFDPLSSQGLFNALYTGLAAAEACHSSLQGDSTACGKYAGEVRNIAISYRKHLTFWYGQEHRWAASAFWQRRSNMNKV